MPPKFFASPRVQQKRIIRARFRERLVMGPPAAPAADALAIRLREVWRTDAAGRVVEAAPRYERFAYAVRHVVRVLHAIAAIGRAQGRGVRIYLGRSAATGSAVASRFRVHSDPEGRDHEFGAVLFRAQTSDAVLWEGRLNRAMEVLSERGGIKVANLAGDARGPVTPRRSSVVYVTWEFIGGRKVRATTRADVGAIVRALVRGDGDLSRDTAEHAFAGLVEPDEMGMIGFVRGQGRSGTTRDSLPGKSAPRRVLGVAAPRR